MNRYICWIWVSILLFNLVGCSSLEGPVDIVKSHIIKLSREDINGAARLCTGEALEITESLQTSINYMKANAEKMDLARDFYLDSRVDLKANMVIEIISETDEGAKVKVTYEDREGTYILSKIDGRWIISRLEDCVFGINASPRS